MARTSGDLYGIRPTVYQLNAKYGASQASNQAAANANRLNQKYGASKENNAVASINTRAGATKDTNKLASLNNQYGASQASNQGLGLGLGLRSPDSSPEPSPRPSDSDTKSDYSGGIGVGGVGLTASNYATPWANKTEVDAANNAWMQQAGLPAGEQPTYNIENSADMDNFRKTYGMYGQDGTGGIFNPAGYSSNPYYLQTMTGITRDMTKGTVLENVPDKIIGSLVKTATPWDNDSWIDPNTGATSSVQQAGFYNKGELRKALARLTNQEYQYALGIQNRAAPLASPGNLGGSDLSAAQQAILDTNRQHAAAMDGGYIPAIGVNAGLWQAGEMPMNRMVQDMVGNAPTQQPPTQPTPPQEDIVTQFLKDLEVERRKKQQNIAEGT